VPQPFAFLVENATFKLNGKLLQVNSYMTAHDCGSEVYTSVSLECRKSAQLWMVSNKFSN
jgi:hypothetical protein